MQTRLIALVGALFFGIYFGNALDAATVQADADPLFDQMVGNWTGEGIRKFPLSNTTTLFDAEVHSKILPDGRLLSRNYVVEKPSNPIADPTEPKEYVRLYWIRAKNKPAETSGPRFYDLGYGTGDAVPRPSAEGVFAQQVFVVTQRLGGNPPYRVDSRTEFVSPDETRYIEKAWQGDTLMAETQVRYRRTDSSRE